METVQIVDVESPPEYAESPNQQQQQLGAGAIIEYGDNKSLDSGVENNLDTLDLTEATLSEEDDYDNASSDKENAPPEPENGTKISDALRTLKLSGHVGFDSLPDQLVNKSVLSGFIFNILCIGETGLGKSTLMDSLFNTSFESSPSPHSLPSVKLKAHTYELQENNVKLKLTIVDTVGYGDQINKEDSFKSIVDYIDNQFEAYLQEELKIKRSLSTYHDNRIHVCLYFICPTGHGLKSLDLVCMKKLDSKLNIIPSFVLFSV
uniref:Septin-2 n=1 Tax=Cacopsylla melanoneura TaxID=428564 RepID=A0A8D9EX55_9HEMI